jgi:hypothetical protein
LHAKKEVFAFTGAQHGQNGRDLYLRADQRKSGALMGVYTQRFAELRKVFLACSIAIIKLELAVNTERRLFRSLGECLHLVEGSVRR